jgi:hypothetical protein
MSLKGISMTVPEQDVLLKMLAEIEDLRACVQVLLGFQNVSFSFEDAKKIAKQANQSTFDVVRKQIEDLA